MNLLIVIIIANQFFLNFKASNLKEILFKGKKSKTTNDGEEASRNVHNRIHFIKW